MKLVMLGSGATQGTLGGSFPTVTGFGSALDVVASFNLAEAARRRSTPLHVRLYETLDQEGVVAARIVDTLRRVASVDLCGPVRSD